jgi:hypothetical protein
MSRIAAGAALVVAVLVGIVLLRQETMSVHQPAPPGSSTRVVVTGINNAPSRASVAARTRAQVALCRLEVHDETSEPVLRPLDEDTFEFGLRPALDESDRRQLHGCLEDALVDHLQLRVERME